MYVIKRPEKFFFWGEREYNVKIRENLVKIW